MQVKGKKSQDDKGCTVTARTKVKVDAPNVRVQRQTSNKYHVHGQEEERILPGKCMPMQKFQACADERKGLD